MQPDNDHTRASCDFFVNKQHLHTVISFLLLGKRYLLIPLEVMMIHTLFDGYCFSIEQMLLFLHLGHWKMLL